MFCLLFPRTNRGVNNFAACATQFHHLPEVILIDYVAGTISCNFGLVDA